ncbi:MAG: ribbon-helix-helix domain-containing protein [Hyphomicrobiales bacterium]
MNRKPEKHSVIIAGHSTSVSLEPEFWEALRRIAKSEGLSAAALLEKIDADRGERNLSSAARVYILNQLQNP